MRRKVDRSAQVQPTSLSPEGTAEAGELLLGAVDYAGPLSTLAQLAVPKLADWCVIHLLQADRSMVQVALAQAAEPAPPEARDWLQHLLPLDDAHGLPAVLRSGEPQLITEVPPDLKAAIAIVKSYMIVPLIAKPQIFGTITFVAAESGRSFDVNALSPAEDLANHIAIYLNMAQLHRQNQQLYFELQKSAGDHTTELRQAIAEGEKSEELIQTVFRISKKLNATLEVKTILDELAQEAIRIVNGESGFAGLRTANGMTVNKYFQRGAAIPFEYTWPEGQGIPGWVLEYKVPYGTSDAAHDPMMQRDLSINADVHSIICTPILDSVGEVLGYFDIRNKQGGEGFTISDQEMLMALAPAASIAIQNALAYQRRLETVAELEESSRQLRGLAANLELAREEERTRISRELHDQLGQALTAMKFDLAWLTDRLGQKDIDLALKAKAIAGQMDTMIKTVRRISAELRPAMLDDLGLSASIEWQARDFEKRTGIACTVAVPAADPPLERTRSVAIFRIFQEALTNVARHAIARHIWVKLTATSGVLMLHIRDDGRGIQAREIQGLHSLGLVGMREHAKRIGGTFDIQGGPGKGTTVTVSLPINQTEDVK